VKGTSASGKGELYELYAAASAALCVQACIFAKVRNAIYWIKSEARTAHGFVDLKAL
jgi:hypothetical protein